MVVAEPQWGSDNPLRSRGVAGSTPDATGAPIASAIAIVSGVTLVHAASDGLTLTGASAYGMPSNVKAVELRVSPSHRTCLRLVRIEQSFKPGTGRHSVGSAK